MVRVVGKEEALGVGVGDCRVNFLASLFVLSG